MIGSCAFDHVPPEARPRVVAAVEKVFSTRELDEYEVLGPPGPDNAREWWSVRAGPLIEGGEVVAATLCATNITQRKQSEEIEARLQEQLRQLQKLESIGRLAGGVAHDFNNLLTSMLGFIDLAQRSQPSGSPAIELLEGATEAARRGGTLTQQLLAFARKQIVHPTVVGINQIIEGMTPMIRSLVGENLEVRLALAHTPDKVKVDVGSLEQVIMNLVVNARDAVVGAGRITLETGIVRLDADYRARSRHDARRARVLRRHRHRLRDVGGGGGACVRAVLHDQAGRQGYRPRSRDVRRHRAPGGRPHHARQRTRARVDLPRLPAARRPTNRRRRSRERRRAARLAAGRPCSSSRMSR